MVETLFKSLNAESICRKRWVTCRQAEAAIFDYITGLYHPRRRHSSLGRQVHWHSNERLRKCAERPELNRDKTKLGWSVFEYNVTGDDHWSACGRIPPQTIPYSLFPYVRLPENRVCQSVISSSVIFRNVTSGTLKLCPAGRAASDVPISLGQL